MIKYSGRAEPRQHYLNLIANLLRQEDGIMDHTYYQRLQGVMVEKER